MANWGQMREQVLKVHPTATLDSIDSWLNQAYELILSQRDWNGLKSDVVIQTGTVYKAGTIAVTALSASIVGTGTVWVIGMSTMMVQISGRSEIYTVTVSTATTATLDRPFEGSTNAAAGYVFFQQEYGLAQVIKNVIRIYNPHIMRDLEEKTRADLMSREPTFGEPLYYAMAPEEGENPTVKGITLYPIPLTAMGLPMDYYRSVSGFNSNNTDEVPLPWVSRGFIQSWAIGMGYVAGSREREGSMATAQQFADGMHNEENRKVPATRITVATRYTRHERKIF